MLLKLLIMYYKVLFKVSGVDYSARFDNVDFADVRTVSEMGMAMMGTAKASGENRASEAAQAAVSSPLLDDVALVGAKGILVNITSGMDMLMSEFEEVGIVKALLLIKLLLLLVR